MCLGCPRMTQTIMSVKNLSKKLVSAGGEFELFVENLELQAGRFYALVGKSGSGKSTLLDLLAMVSSPSAIGDFTLFAKGERTDVAGLLSSGDDAELSRVRREAFSYILQTGGLFQFLTVRENIELPFQIQGLTAEPGYIEDLAAQFDMKAQLDKKPSGLSGGQRQRASILRALAVKPAVVLADEPTAAIDETMADVIVAEMKALASQQGSTVVMVSHDTDLVERFSEETYLLKPMVVSSRLTRSTLSRYA